MYSSKVGKSRGRISQLWHERMDAWWDKPHQSFANEDRYFAFCAAKDWIQDTADALDTHREQEFSKSASNAYLEFWGIMQAVFIQQDAILELQYSLTGERTLPRKCVAPKWHEIRDLRNLSVGHPTKKGGKTVPRARCVTGRQSKSYNCIPLTIYSHGDVMSKDLNLGKLLEEYDTEASLLLDDLYSVLLEQLGIEPEK